MSVVFDCFLSPVIPSSGLLTLYLHFLSSSSILHFSGHSSHRKNGAAAVMAQQSEESEEIKLEPSPVEQFQTPLMMAAIHGKISCVEKLLHAGANILMFDSLRGRTCLHYAAYYGHSECLKLIISTARTSHVAISWGFARFVNIRDGKGATPLHLAEVVLKRCWLARYWSLCVRYGIYPDIAELNSNIDHPLPLYLLRLLLLQYRKQKKTVPQVFVRDFVPSVLAFLLNGEPEIVKKFLLKTLRLQSWEKKIDRFQLGEGVMPSSFKVFHDPVRNHETLIADFGEKCNRKSCPY